MIFRHSDLSRSTQLAAVETGWRTMERLQKEVPPFVVEVRQGKMDPLPTIEWTYACEVTALADGGTLTHHASKTQAVPYVMVVLEGPLLFAHASECASRLLFAHATPCDTVAMPARPATSNPAQHE